MSTGKDSNNIVGNCSCTLPGPCQACMPQGHWVWVPQPWYYQPYTYPNYYHVQPPYWTTNTTGTDTTRFTVT